jgi:hypothetical protein
MKSLSKIEERNLELDLRGFCKYKTGIWNFTKLKKYYLSKMEFGISINFYENYIFLTVLKLCGVLLDKDQTLQKGLWKSFDTSLL